MAREGHAALFGSPAPAAAPAPVPAPAAAATPAAAVEKHGTLGTRHADIPRDASGIMHLAQNWETRAIVPYTTINKMNHPLKLMITNEIRPIIAELDKKQHLKTVKGQFRGYFESSMEPVRCWELHGNHIEAVMDTVLGGMTSSGLKKTINDSTIGKLNKYLAVLRTYIEEELDSKHRSAIPYCAALSPLTQLVSLYACTAAPRSSRIASSSQRATTSRSRNFGTGGLQRRARGSCSATR